MTDIYDSGPYMATSPVIASNIHVRYIDEQLEPPYKILFFTSLTILTFEIVLIRIFSIRFSYHYASMIISISMIGLVPGSIYAYYLRALMFRVFPCLKSPYLYAFIMSLSYPAILILSSVLPLDYHRMLWENIQILYSLLFIFLLSIPFFLYGTIFSLVISQYAAFAHRVYASDLAGAAAGTALAVLLLNHAVIEHIVAVLSILLAILSFFSNRRMPIKIFYLVAPLTLCIPVISGYTNIEISPYQGLAQAVNEKGGRIVKTINTSSSRLDIFENPRMKTAAGLSLKYTKPVPKGQGIAMDGDVTGVLMDERHISTYGFFSFMPPALPYMISKPQDIVVVGMKNSLDALLPYYFGAVNVYKAEEDLSLWHYIEKGYPPDSLFRKGLIKASGRKMIADLNKKVDLISISRTGYFPSGTLGLLEDYDMTSDAIRQYLKALNKEGFIFIQLFLLPPPRYELRVMNNILQAFNQSGIPYTERHRHLITYRSWDTVNFLVKKASFTEYELYKAKTFLDDREFEIIYPDESNKDEHFISGPDYRKMLSDIADNTKKHFFMRDYLFDVRATTDNRPFFHSFLKLDKLREIYILTGKKYAYFIHEGMALPFVLCFLIVLSLLMFTFVFLFPAVKKHNRYGSDKEISASAPVYIMLCFFILIGFAFMFVEVFFIHRLILSLGSPITAFSAVLITLLLSSGSGSLLCGSIKCNHVFYAGLVLPVLLVFYYLLSDRIMVFEYSYLFIIPAGCLMGFFFPSGIKLLCSKNDKYIPLAYAANGVASIIAPPLASLFALVYGLKLLFILSALSYCLPVFFLCLSCHGDKGNTA